ncbi:MAG TPA: peptidylprolyl isomerase [Candidatus Thermoplasmatota archaeon]|nr:peptidylprolyl isomerase [Candidatus Thermoplasmatota archaeon]
MVAALAGCLSSNGSAEKPTVSREAILFDTEFGPLTVILYPEAAPETVSLLKAYVGEGYYDGRVFYRTVPGHVIQVTDLHGLTEDARTVPLEPMAGFSFSAGAAGIARSEDPHSGGPEFFLMDFATGHLDGNYTVWGQVVEGLRVVHHAARVPAIEFPRLPGETPSVEGPPSAPAASSAPPTAWPSTRSSSRAPGSSPSA